MHRLPVSLSALRLSILALLWLALLGAGCADPAADFPDLEEVPAPPLDSVEEVAREQIETARDAVDDARDAAQLAGAYGKLGRVYHAYDLDDAALVAYANARRIEPKAFPWPYLEGVLLQDSGEFQAAITAYQAALEVQPRNVPALMRLGESYLALGEPEESIEHFESVIGGGAEASGFWGLGRAAAAMDDHRQAIAHFRSGLEREEAGALRSGLAASFRALGKTEQAAKAAEKASALPPTLEDPLLERVESLARSSGAALRRGNRALVAGDYDTAVTEFRAGVAAAPDSAELRANLALAHVRQGDLEAARLVLDDAVERTPTARLYFDLGTVLASQGRSDEAIDAYEKALELEPDFADAWFNLANLYVVLERWDDAGSSLERYVALRPDDVRGLYLQAMSMHGRGESTEAERQLRALAQANPDDPVPQRGLATVYVDRRSPKAAARAFELALAKSPEGDERTALFDEAARQLWKIGDRKGAIALWRQWVDEQPRSATARIALGNALQLSGKRQPAAQQFARATALDPQNRVGWLSEISLWIIEGRFVTARERLDEALAIHGNDIELLHTAARLYSTASNPKARDPQRALVYARRVYGLQATPEHAETLAMAFAAVGAFEEAIRVQRNLATQAQAQGDRNTLARLVTNLRKYENREPVRLSTD